VDGTDDVVKSYTYEAYGKTSGTGTFVNSFAYTGAVNDEETGLVYMNARYYDPDTGRFISQDTYRGDGETFWNLYLYCNGDPVNCVDPTGHTYRRSKAIAYAKNWYGRFNTKYAKYKSDCSNFVSQCLYAGGISMTRNWFSYKNPSTPNGFFVSYSWRVVENQYRHFRYSGYCRGKLTISRKTIFQALSKGVRKGDIMFFDKDGNGVPDHATLITFVTRWMLFYTAHIKPRWNKPVTYFFGQQSSTAKAIILKMRSID